MNHNRYLLLQVAILFGLGFYLLGQITTGKLLWYINVRFAALTLMGMLSLFLLGGNSVDRMRRARRSPESHADHAHSAEQHHDHAHVEHEHNASPANLFWLAIPLIIGLLFPARPLGASAAAYKGITLSGPLAAGGSQLAELSPAPDQRTVLDWIRLFNFEEDLSPRLGEPANVIGFVYLDPRLPQGQFLVARFTVSCCVADAFAIGMAVDWPEALPADTWVNVRGPVEVLTIQGQRLPLIRAESVTIVSAPDQPYLFP
jgi:uncharacterized repeat protein (TIGR03943 family)